MFRSLAQVAWAGVRPMTLSMARSPTTTTTTTIVAQRSLNMSSIMSSPVTRTLTPLTWPRTEGIKLPISANFSTSTTVQGQFAVNRKRKTARLKSKLKAKQKRLRRNKTKGPWK